MFWNLAATVSAVQMGDLLCGGLDKGSNELKEKKAKSCTEEGACNEASDVGGLIPIIEELNAAVGDHRQHPEKCRPCREAPAYDEQDDNGNFPE